VPADAQLWVMLQLKSGSIPALVDTGAQFACVRSNIAEYLYLMGEPCVFGSCSVGCVLADGTRYDLTNSVRLHIKLLSFTWKHEFKVLNGGPFPIILGLDFLRQTSMFIDVASKRFSFQCSGEFGDRSEETGGDPFFQSLVAQVSEVVGSQAGGSDDFNVGVFSSEFPALFSSALGTANCVPYEIEFSDSMPMRSALYRCAPPKTGDI
jgi:hypothetical protein